MTPDGLRPRVLLVDDYPGMLTSLKRLLEPDCDVVGGVADGAAAFGAVAALQPDVVVLDLNLPDIGGLEVCRRIRQTNTHAKVILVSAMDDAVVRERGLAAGAVAVLAKYQLGDVLLPTIQKARVG